MSLIFTILFIVAWLASAVTLYSVGDITSTKAGGLVKTVHWSDTTRYLMVYQIFGFLWLLAMILACTAFVIIGSVCMWYFSFNSDTKATSSIFKTIGWIFRYHMGSIAFGSFLIALVWFVRIIFEYINKKISGGGVAPANPLISCLSCCCRCCLACCNKFIKFINENAYTQVILASTNFCSSAINSFTLMLKHAGTFAISTGIASLIIFLGKMTVSVIATGVGYVLVTEWSYISDSILEPFAPCVVFFISSYIITSVYMSIFSTSVCAILQCFLVDVDVTKKTTAEEMIDCQNRPKELEELVRSL
jgi:hypothetical protein